MIFQYINFNNLFLYYQLYLKECVIWSWKEVSEGAFKESLINVVLTG